MYQHVFALAKTSLEEECLEGGEPVLRYSCCFLKTESRRLVKQHGGSDGDVLGISALHREKQLAMVSSEIQRSSLHTP